MLLTRKCNAQLTEINQAWWRMQPTNVTYGGCSLLFEKRPITGRQRKPFALQVGVQDVTSRENYHWQWMDLLCPQTFTWQNVLLMWPRLDLRWYEKWQKPLSTFQKVSSAKIKETHTSLEQLGGGVSFHFWLNYPFKALYCVHSHNQRGGRGCWNILYITFTLI